MRTTALKEISTQIDYGLTASANSTPVGPKLLRITDIQDGAVDWTTVPYCQSDDRKLSASRLRVGDIVFARTGATTGKSYLIRQCPENAVFASYLIRVRPSECIDPIFLAHFFDSSSYWTQISLKATGAAQTGVNASKLKELEVPLPPLPEQRRIAAILDQANALRAKRREGLIKLEDMPQAIFLKTFGEPGLNPKKYAACQLSDVSTFQSGGTPSKSRPEFWGKGLPWVSPKDMKSLRIRDSIDHVTQAALENGNVKRVGKDAILIVVRGMILAHTVPISLAEEELTINQDIKAIRFSRSVVPEFGFWCLRVQHKRLLGDIDTASHGTKRLNIDRLRRTPMLLPDEKKQSQFAKSIQQWERILSVARHQLTQADSIFASLQHRAFRGEL